MEPKPFAVGVRAEHPQPLIDACQYRAGRTRPASLPPADYRLAHTSDGRGVYSFCMCPGGMVVPTVTEAEALVVNGMSSARRSSPFANSGLVAQVNLHDIEREGFSRGPFSGVEFQRHIERAAFAVGGGGYRTPAVKASDFVKRKISGDLPATRFRPGLTPANLDDVFPAFITQSLRDGLQRFDKTIPGYASSDATLIAAETRTSSPIRIPRDADTFEVPGFSGLFVSGEGPGYAGGIVSAAADGIKVARAIVKQLSNAV